MRVVTSSNIYFVAETKGYDKDNLKDYSRAESVKIEWKVGTSKPSEDNGYIYDVAKDYKSLYDIVTK